MNINLVIPLAGLFPVPQVTRAREVFSSLSAHPQYPYFSEYLDRTRNAFNKHLNLCRRSALQASLSQGMYNELEASLPRAQPSSPGPGVRSVLRGAVASATRRVRGSSRLLTLVVVLIAITVSSILSNMEKNSRITLLEGELARRSAPDGLVTH